MSVLSTRIVLDCFYLLIFYSEKFSTDVCRLPYTVNVNLNLSNMGKASPHVFFKLNVLTEDTPPVNMDTFYGPLSVCINGV